MALEITGKLIESLPEQTGQGNNGPWRKGAFVIETSDSKYPKKICFSVWGDRIDDVKRFTPGNTVTVSFDIESRNYNDRWYTEAKMWKIDGIASPNAAQNPAMNQSVDVDPFAGPPTVDDDLPF